MKLLFVHGTKIKVDNKNNYYTGGSYNKDTWARYLNICDKLSVIGRKEPETYKEEDAKKKFNFFDKEKIKFIEVPNLNSSLKTFIDINKRKKREYVIKASVLKNDFIIVRLPSTEGNLAIKYARKFNKPYLVEVVGCSWDALWYYNLKGKILAPIRFLKQKRMVRNAPFVVYVTNNFLQSRYPTKGKYVNCSNVVLENIDSNILMKRIEKINKLDLTSKIVIGTVGGIDVKYKNQESVVVALGKLKQKGITNFEYQLVGGGNPTYLAAIAEENNVSEHVKYLGSIPHAKVLAWLDTVDVYIQPSKTEGLPRALIEAMSRGVLSIGTNAGGIPELLDEKYIVNKSNGVENAIKNILMQIDKKSMLDQAQRNFSVSKNYEKNVIERRRLKFFQEFINHGSNLFR